MDREERGYVFLSHLFTAIPLWGILFNGVMWISFKERSRQVVYHAQQGIFFQVIFLAAILVGLVAFLFTQVVGVINGPLAAVLSFINWIIIVMVWIVFEIICIIGMATAANGNEFHYPFVAQKLKEGRPKEETSPLQPENED